MSDDPVQNNLQKPGVAVAAMYLGIGSLVALYWDGLWSRLESLTC